MKRITKRVISLSLFVLFVLSVSLSMPASAAVTPTTTIEAGIYGFLSGSCVQNEIIPEVLNTTTRVTKNPDDAKLRVDFQLVYYSTDGNKVCIESEPDVESFTYTYPMGVNLDLYPELVYCTHNVLQGTQSPVGYFVTQTVFLEFDLK